LKIAPHVRASISYNYLTSTLHSYSHVVLICSVPVISGVIGPPDRSGYAWLDFPPSRHECFVQFPYHFCMHLAFPYSLRACLAKGEHL
jgi:hypothetical protein